MGSAKRLGPDFTRLWAANTASALGSAVATDAFVMITVLVLGGGELRVSLLAALGGTAGALLALPLGPWIEFRAKRPVMIGADLVRFAVLATVPIAYAAGALTFPHLMLVSVVVATGQIVFTGASGPYLKSLVPPGRWTEANGRFESARWVCLAVGPPLGGFLVSLLGPAVTVLADAGSYLLSALGLRSIAAPEPEPPARRPDHGRRREIVEGWRHILADGTLRLLFVNAVMVSALISATAPVLAVMMLRDLHFTTLQYGLSLGLPCIAGVAGARLGRRFPRRGRRAVLLGAGVLRVLWLPLLPLVGGGWGGLAAIALIHTCTVFFMSVFLPVFATVRLERAGAERTARVLTAWSITDTAVRAGCIVTWGLLATLTSPRFALAAGAALAVAAGLCL
uniref:MFS transporter n=1 Tax=Actinomadura roseirufa TaxID=2094049 RepID=UPI001041732E